MQHRRRDACEWSVPLPRDRRSSAYCGAWRAGAFLEALKKSVMNVEEELRGRGTTSLWRCREADRQNMLGLATIVKHDGEVQMSARPRTNAIRITRRGPVVPQSISRGTCYSPGRSEKRPVPERATFARRPGPTLQAPQARPAL